MHIANMLHKHLHPGSDPLPYNQAKEEGPPTFQAAATSALYPTPPPAWIVDDATSLDWL